MLINLTSQNINNTRIPVLPKQKKEQTFAAVGVLNELLGGSAQSKLFINLREKQNLAYYVKSYYENIDGLYGKFSLNIETNSKDKNSDSLQKCLGGFKNNINDLIQNTVSEEELKIAKINLKNSILSRFGVSENRNDMLQTGLSSFYGINYTNELLSAIDTIEPVHIKRAAQMFLDKPSVISIVANKETLDT